MPHFVRRGMRILKKVNASIQNQSGTAGSHRSIRFLNFSAGSWAIAFKRMMRDAGRERKKGKYDG